MYGRMFGLFLSLKMFPNSFFKKLVLDNLWRNVIYLIVVLRYSVNRWYTRRATDIQPYKSMVQCLCPF